MTECYTVPWFFVHFFFLPYSAICNDVKPLSCGLLSIIPAPFKGCLNVRVSFLQCVQPFHPLTSLIGTKTTYGLDFNVMQSFRSTRELRKTDLQPNTPLKAEWLLFHVVWKCVKLFLGGATCKKFYVLYKYKILRCFAHLDSITGPPLSCLCVFSDPFKYECLCGLSGVCRHD